MAEEARPVTVPKHANPEDLVEKEPKNTKKIAGIVAGSILAVLVAAYVGGALFFGSHFFPNTAYGDTDISFKTQEELVKKIDEEVSNYSLSITGDGFEMELTKEQVPVEVDSAGVAKAAMAVQNAWVWPVELFKAHDFSASMNAAFDKDAVNKLVSAEVEKYNKDAENPKAATIVYKEPEEPAEEQPAGTADAAPAEESSEATEEASTEDAKAAEGEEAADAEKPAATDDLKAEDTPAPAADTSKGGFVIQEEVYGTAIDVDALMAKVDEEISGLGTKIEITKDELIQPAIFADDPRLPEAVKTANSFVAGDIKLTLDEDVDAGTIPATTIATWVTLDKDVKAVLDTDAVEEFVAEEAEEYNTVGTKRTYKRPDGKECTVSGGTYGWEIDEEGFAELVLENVQAGKNDPIDIPCSQTAATYAGAGKADWGKYVDVDLSEQVVRYYDADGELLKECNCVSGKNSSPTPTGAFYLRHKESPSTLISYYPDGTKKYETKVKYWMPFDRNVVGLHDAWWRGSFGGTIYKNSGSHGCVNISSENAKWFYSELTVGTPVIVHD